MKPGQGMRQITMSETVTFVLMNDNRTIYTVGRNTEGNMGMPTSSYELYDKLYTIDGVTKDIEYIEGLCQVLIVAYKDGTFAHTGDTSGFSGLAAPTVGLVEVPRWANEKSISMQ